jgi:ribosomal protein L7/L12
MVRQHWNLGLKEAKHLVDAVPVDLPKLSPAETASAQEALASLDAVMIMK